MIRAATELLGEHVRGVVLAVVLLAVSWVTAGGALFFSASVGRVVRGWMRDLQPAVYLETGEGSEMAEELSRTISKWEGVGEVVVRTPSEAYRETVERLGEERLTGVGVEPGMFPFSILVKPVGPFGSVDLAARLEALETRDAVETVDVPSTAVQNVLGSMRRLMYGFAVPLVALVMASLAHLGAFLGRLRRTERRELSLAERFGATRWSLSRPTLVRGAMVGLWAGLAATGILLVMALYWRTIEASIFGGASAATPGSWWVVAAPLLASPVGGALTGAIVAYTGSDSDSEDARACLSTTERLLDHG